MTAEDETQDVEMGQQLDGAQWVAIVKAMAAAVERQKDVLSFLDAKVGDGDHGINMAAGLITAAVKVEQLPDPTPAEVLNETGFILMNEMGGASGLVFGIFFRSCGSAVKDKALLDKNDIGAMLAASIENVITRGRAHPGDKTMVDALAPAVEAYLAAIDGGVDLVEALGQAAEAAKTGAEATKEMAAKVGRAKFLGQRSIGIQDAGATTMALLFNAWREAI